MITSEQAAICTTQHRGKPFNLVQMASGKSLSNSM